MDISVQTEWSGFLDFDSDFQTPFVFSWKIDFNFNISKQKRKFRMEKVISFKLFILLELKSISRKKFLWSKTWSVLEYIQNGNVLEKKQKILKTKVNLSISTVFPFSYSRKYSFLSQKTDNLWNKKFTRCEMHIKKSILNFLFCLEIFQFFFVVSSHRSSSQHWPLH